MRARCLPAAAVAALVVGCSAGAGVGAPPSREISVLAASSLQDAFRAAAAAFEVTPSGSTVSLGFDASSALRAKIEEGAPADLFASADVSNAQKLADDGFAIGAPQPFARNRLAIVVPVANPARIETPRDLARPGLRIVAAAAGVPISAYAEELLAGLAKVPGYPHGYATRVKANVVSREENVSAVAAKIALGEGDAAIVYATDAAATSKLRTIPIPAGVDVSVTYAAVVVKGATHAEAARAFLAWLSGGAGQAVLARFGFLPA